MFRGFCYRLLGHNPATLFDGKILRKDVIEDCGLSSTFRDCGKVRDIAYHVTDKGIAVYPLPKTWDPNKDAFAVSPDTSWVPVMGKYEVGFHKEAGFEPTDIERKTTFDYGEVTDDNDMPWKVPAIRSPLPDRCQLPVESAYDLETGKQSYKIQTEYEELFERLGRHLAVHILQSDSDEFSDDGIEDEVVWVCETARMVMEVNYRLSLGALHVLKTEFENDLLVPLRAYVICHAACDWQLFERFKKKQDGIAQDSSEPSHGAEVEYETIDQLGVSLQSQQT